MNKLWKSLTVLGFAFVLGACSAEEVSQYSPDQIVANAVEKESDMKRYYMKAEFNVLRGDEQIDDSTMEQWTDTENNRTKVVSKTAGGEVSKSVNDGEKVIFYSDLQGEAYEMEAPELASSVTGQNQREQIEQTLEQTRQTHDIELVGEEKVNGFNTYHIKAVPKEEGGIRGEEEYWVTTEHWFVVKFVSETDDIDMEYNVSELKVDPSFDDQTFTIDLPEGVEVLPFEDMDPSEEITIEEVGSAYGQPVLTLMDGAYQRVKIDQIEMENFDRTEVNQEYEKDGYQQFTLTVFEAPEDEEMALGLGEEEELEVRGTKAIYTEDVITTLTWEEEGLRYSLLAQNPDLTKDEIIEIVEKLEYTE
ncbi:LolA family protein [Halobacillus litoralis]|uniref:DUF4367 domain-containing protein n=1 Tax=Halobacillus litoralis TaxID=45668 RepID=A0A410MHR8_9BACI|nr:DUF4367 domain-containing protein [Halobacillus litoralis]QAS54297.1 hypothetical protein HLI_19800 [Halobacillus litoralis]